MHYMDFFQRLNKYVFSVKTVSFQEVEKAFYFDLGKLKIHSIIFISKGNGELVINGKTEKVSTGTIFFLSPGMSCKGGTTKDDPMEFYFITFDYAFVYEENEEWNFDRSEGIDFQLSGSLFIQYPIPVIQCLEKMYRNWKMRGRIYTFHVKTLFYQFFYEVISDIRAQRMEGDTRFSIERTLDYIDHHYREALTLSDLAKIAGMSNSYYSKIFKKYVEVSPINYLTRVRIDQAKQILLLSKNSTLREVAKSIGYQDEFYFSRIFKKVEGISPREYIQKQKK